MSVMVEDSKDRQLISGYLLGVKAARQEVDNYILTAMSSFSDKIDKDTGDIFPDIHDKLRKSLEDNTFRGDSKFRTYVARVSTHTCIDFIRYHKKFVKESPEELSRRDESLNPEQQLERKQAARLRFRVLRQLPKECLKMWQLLLKHELTCAQIGKIMGKREENIRRRLWVCREEAKKVREKILKRDKPLGRSFASRGEG